MRPRPGGQVDRLTLPDASRGGPGRRRSRFSVPAIRFDERMTDQAGPKRAGAVISRVAEHGVAPGRARHGIEHGVEHGMEHGQDIERRIARLVVQASNQHPQPNATLDRSSRRSLKVFPPGSSFFLSLSTLPPLRHPCIPPSEHTKKKETDSQKGTQR